MACVILDGVMGNYRLCGSASCTGATAPAPGSGGEGTGGGPERMFEAQAAGLPPRPTHADPSGGGEELAAGGRPEC
ncbi:hypothetical protein GCM10023075_66070 [Streptosporangium album]